MEETTQETSVDVALNVDGDTAAEAAVTVTDQDILRERILALVRAILIAVSTAGTLFGFAFDAELWFNVISTVLMVIFIGAGYWKNNNWTELAGTLQAIFKVLKAGKSVE